MVVVFYLLAAVVAGERQFGGSLWEGGVLVVGGWGGHGGFAKRWLYGRG